MENYTIFDVAKWFLNKDSFMSHKKLQKLCWYAYSWDIFLNYNIEEKDVDKKFIKETRAEAWVHGAVFPELYADFRYNSKIMINDSQTIINEEFLAFLNRIYDIYGEFTGEELESINHQEKPWIKARGECGPFDRCANELEIKYIIEEYRSRYE